MKTVHEKLLEAVNSENALRSLEDLQRESKLPGEQFWDGVRNWIACYIVKQKQEGEERERLKNLFIHAGNRLAAFQMPTLKN